MGQYKKHFYGSTLYGKLPSFYGTYTTEVFDAEEPFTGVVEGTLQCLLPFTTYRPDTYETELTGAWTINGSKQAVTSNMSSTFKFKATGRNVAVKFLLQNKSAQDIKLVLKKEDGTVVKELTESTYSLTTSGIKTVSFGELPYALYIIEGSIVSGTTPFILDSFYLHSAEVGLELRASKDAKTWSDWEVVDITHTLKNNKWIVKGVGKVKHVGVQYIQGRITLLSSEEQSAPTVEKIELLAGDSGLRSEDGMFIATINVASIATAIGKKFAKTRKITWKSKNPENTIMNVRSSSSDRGEFYGAITAPYRQNTKRLRLKEGVLKHSVLIGPIDPSKKQPFWKTLQWNNWDDISFLPKDSSEVGVNYVFSKTSTNKKDPVNLLQLVKQPMNEDNKALKFKPQPYYVTIEMERTRLKGTPVVDVLDMYALMEYKEVKSIENKDISAVDSNNIGIKPIQAVKDTVFQEPVLTGENAYNANSIKNVIVQYILTDKTNRPTEEILYYESEKDKGAKSNVTTNKNDRVFAKALVRYPEKGDKTGVLKHYQYSGGSVQYLRPFSHEMESTFTPSLDAKKLYRYYLLDGWPDERHVVVTGDNLPDIASLYNVSLAELNQLNPKPLYDKDKNLLPGQELAIPNHTWNKKVQTTFGNGTDYTEKSSHNARLKGETDLSSEGIKAEVPTSPEFEYVPWVSEEKIYDGIINPEDIRGAYIRTQYQRSSSSSLEREYTLQVGDTWEKVAKKFEVTVDDLKAKNEGLEIKAGVNIVIPPNILLPHIPVGVEFDGAFPYELVIVENSIHKEDGSVLDESLIPVDWNGKHKPIVATYRESQPVTLEVTRGDVLNDRDALGHAGVIKIISVKNAAGTMSYHPWDDDLQTGDYKLNGDYIDWSPAKQESREPAKGEKYTVVYTHNEVDKVTIHLDSPYEEETGTDVLWRSPEMKVIDGVCTPDQDFIIPMPAIESFEGYGERGVEDYGFIVEDNDLWVETSVFYENNQPFLLGTMKKRNPKVNWHPLINTGYYYLKEDEYYLYSEALVTPLTEKEIPIAKNISYEKTPKDMGIVLTPKRTNHVLNSTFNNKEMKTATTFKFKK